ncbi:MAG: ATP-binding protein [Chloroflexota bacterium]
MAAHPEKFAELLTEAVHRVRIRESKSVQIVQDELGYALGREGGSAVEYWRKGHIPPKLSDVERLARELVQRGQLEQHWLQAFLQCAEHPAPHLLRDELFEEVTVSELRRAAPKSELPSIDSYAPFIVGPPIVHPGKFFGRAAQIKRIFGAWQQYPLQNVAIVGPKRSGKSSLLHYTKNIFQVDPTQLRPSQSAPDRSGLLTKPTQLSWVYVDFQDIRMWSQERLLRHVLETLSLPVPNPCDLSRFMDTMIDHLHTPTIILMDEIGAALEAPELDMPFWWSLRSLGTSLTDGNLGYLIASHQPPIELAADRGKPSPFFNIFGHVLNLGPLEDEAAHELITAAPIALTSEDADWILKESQGWPLLLQILCHSYAVSREDDREQGQDVGKDDSAWKEDGLSRIEPYGYLLR